ncbi:hypothetical protein F0562_005035 [Nyssa sinensis]|uniref:AP2/ERF domain-containing protein n=1 Tax=Nyssa sinensis TaxID=561372 RepID=A0A5J5AL28_9ASTE|nr:hypothetical protein F0562_005035 [Nyssa sinensis]
MATITVKNEEKRGKRRVCMVDGEAAEARCVKRRRRDSTAAVLGCDNQQIQHQQPHQQVDQTSVPNTVKRSSRFRGVSKHRWTGRFEAHLWDKLSWNPTQKKKGKQGAFDEEESAARAYDLAALKYWGTSTFTNFPVSDYEEEIDIMKTVTKEEYLASLRRKSSGFSRGTQEEAARAYDIAAIEYRGINAVTNFDLSTYIRWLKPEANSLVAAPEPQTNRESQAVISSNFISGDESQPLLFHTSDFAVDDLNSYPAPKQEVLQRKFPVTSCNKSSSPTALGLLLQSSIFRELVEKNLNMTEQENDGEDTKNQPQMGNTEDEYKGIFYDGNGDLPFALSFNSHNIEFQGEFHFGYNPIRTAS